MKFTCSAFFFVCALLLALTASASYYRFMVAEDYTVEYEGECDPETESCFVGCDDEECAEVYYYMIMSKHASDLHDQCGPDITECEEASMCLPDERACSVTYCSPESLQEGEACEEFDGPLPDESSEEGEGEVEEETDEATESPEPALL